jgi:hypothetical protein
LAHALLSRSATARIAIVLLLITPMIVQQLK